jgi:protein gp37
MMQKHAQSDMAHLSDHSRIQWTDATWNPYPGLYQDQSKLCPRCLPGIFNRLSPMIDEKCS